MTEPFTDTNPVPPENQSQEQRLQAMLSALWDRSRHTVIERTTLLQAAGALLIDDRLDEPTRQSAVDSAHKLAGVLGTFGLPHGTELAREAEIFFGRINSSHAPPDKQEIEKLQVMLAELARLVDRGPMGP
jgi:HPt (histidine-containing phosphotransfer) domain-containing protein